MNQRKHSPYVLRAFLPAMLFLLLLSGGPVHAEINPEPYDRVIIFGVDAAGTMIRKGDTPNFDRIFADGIITYDAYAPVPTISAPGWGSVFYGVPGTIHGVDNDFAEKFHKSNDLYTSIFKLTKEAYPEADVASFSTWSAINWGMIERDCGIYLYPDTQKEPTKEEMAQQAVDYLEQHNPKLMFVYFGDLDIALHNYGYGSREYFDEMSKTDNLIGLVYDELERRGLLENTLILFVTDHGGNGTGHGGGTEAEVRITFAAAGPRIETHGAIEDMEIQDVAAIVLYALGVEQPENQTGRVPKGIFSGVGGGKRNESDLPQRLARYGGGIPEPEQKKWILPTSLEEKLVYYQDFDGEIKGISGAKELSPGLTGSGLNMRKSFLKTGIKNQSKWPGMTIGFWFKGEDTDGDPVFVADKNWKKGSNKGFSIALFRDSIHVNIGCGQKTRGDLFWNLPIGYGFRGKWIHCMVIFDQAARTVSLYFNFECVVKAAILPSKHSSWVSGKGIFAGQDITGKYRYWMNGDLDDLMIFNQPLTAEEVEEIRNSYEVLFTE